VTPRFQQTGNRGNSTLILSHACAHLVTSLYEQNRELTSSDFVPRACSVITISPLVKLAAQKWVGGQLSPSDCVSVQPLPAVEEASDSVLLAVVGGRVVAGLSR
jgi:hypothetical protein